DLAGNQLAGFFPGASVAAGELSITGPARHARFGLVGATTLDAMRRHASEIADAGCKLIYDPSQQIVAAPPEDLAEGISRAWAVTGSDYEFAMIERKTGLGVSDIARQTELVVVTLGGEGSALHAGGRAISIPVAPPEQVVDPTGGGDAYRAGLIKGLLLGLPLEVCGRMGALAATYAIEKYGTQEHRFDAGGFTARFDAAFPDYAGAVSADALTHPAPVRAGV
ncbi:MAG: PfkB family carbohydrate kinase, partial [Chloroflexota bacterium]